MALVCAHRHCPTELSAMFMLRCRTLRSLPAHRYLSSRSSSRALSSTAISFPFQAARGQPTRIHTAHAISKTRSQLNVSRSVSIATSKRPQQSTDREAPISPQPGLWSRILHFVWNRLAVLAVVFVAAQYIIAGQLMFVTGPSMSPTLSPDYIETGRRDYVWASTREVFWDNHHSIPKGSIIAFWSVEFLVLTLLLVGRTVTSFTLNLSSSSPIYQFDSNYCDLFWRTKHNGNSERT